MCHSVRVHNQSTSVVVVVDWLFFYSRAKNFIIKFTVFIKWTTTSLIMELVMMIIFVIHLLCVGVREVWMHHHHFSSSDHVDASWKIRQWSCEYIHRNLVTKPTQRPTIDIFISNAGKFKTQPVKGLRGISRRWLCSLSRKYVTKWCCRHSCSSSNGSFR